MKNGRGGHEGGNDGLGRGTYRDGGLFYDLVCYTLRAVALGSWSHRGVGLFRFSSSLLFGVALASDWEMQSEGVSGFRASFVLAKPRAGLFPPLHAYFKRVSWSGGHFGNRSSSDGISTAPIRLTCQRFSSRQQ